MPNPALAVKSGALKGLKQIAGDEFEATVDTGNKLQKIRFQIHPDRAPNDEEVYLIAYQRE